MSNFEHAKDRIAVHPSLISPANRKQDRMQINSAELANIEQLFSPNQLILWTCPSLKPMRKVVGVKSETHSILLVEDEPSVRESMAMVLRSQGYSVATATHGIDALFQLEHAIPDVVISDLNMPEMSGFEFLPIVRQRFPSVGLIAVSGIYDAGGMVPAGVVVDAFYAKGRPRPEHLLNTVAEVIQTRMPDLSGPEWCPAAE
jgi:CheY-like chemotaxis protein